jgi:[ribosomal protein S18]-alanine N-acetyltransferase
LNIRTASPADIPKILSLERTSPTAAHWSERTYRDRLGDEGPESLVLLVEDKGAIKGFLVVRIIPPGWEIENIVVADSARRHGIGSLMLNELLRRARIRSEVQILLEVRASNVPARRLYEKLGFLKSGRRVAYYRDPLDDAILYSLCLG